MFEYLGDEAAIAAAVDREAGLCAAFGLAELRERSSRRDYRETLDLLDAFESVEGSIRSALARRSLQSPLRVVDVGARNWSYVGALERFFARMSPGLAQLLGVEVDGNGRDADGYRRVDYARSYAAQAAELGSSEVRYEVADFRRWSRRGDPVDCVSMLFPFVLRYPLLAWGMPLYMFDPLAMLRSAVDALRPETGLLVSMHQTVAELEAMLRHLGSLDGQLEVLVARRHSSRLVAHWPAMQDRHILVARRVR